MQTKHQKRRGALARRENDLAGWEARRESGPDPERAERKARIARQDIANTRRALRLPAER